MLIFSLCTDNNYAIPALVCITSIFENHKDADCKIYVLTAGLSEEVTRKFDRLAETYSRQIVVHEVGDNEFAELKTRNRYRTSMYYRFLLPEIVEEDRVLYLDCDIIVRKNLKELFSTNLSDVASAVVEDQRSDEIELHNRIRVASPYFNSGVMLMNLNYWREHKVKDALVKYIIKNPARCHFPDQDALNAVLVGKLCFLPYTYNFQEQWYWFQNDDTPTQAECAISFTKWEEIAKFKDDPAIAHYTWNLKPWHEQCWHIHKDWFLQYAYLHDWIGFKIQPRYKPTFLSRCLAFIMKRCLNGIRWSDKEMNKKKVEDILSFYAIR